MWLCWGLIISDYKSDSSWETCWRKVCLRCWSSSYYWATACLSLLIKSPEKGKNSQISGPGRRSEPKPGTQGTRDEGGCIPPCPGDTISVGQSNGTTFPTVGSGNLRNCSFIKHIRDSALFAYWYPWRRGIQRWGCECYLLYHHFQAAWTVLFALE